MERASRACLIVTSAKKQIKQGSDPITELLHIYVTIL